MPRGKKKITRKHRGGGNGANGFPTAPPAPQNQLMMYPAGSYPAGTFPNGFITQEPGYYIYLPPASPTNAPPPPTLFASGQAGAGRYPPTFFPNGFWAAPPGYYPDPPPPPAPTTSEMSVNQMKATLQQYQNQQTRNREALASTASSLRQSILNQGKAAENSLNAHRKLIENRRGKLKL